MDSGRNYGAVREYRDDPESGFAPYRDQRSPFQSASNSNELASHLSDKISTNIFKINSNATTLERASKQIGTNKDSVQLRDRIHSSEQSTNFLIKETAEAFHSFSRNISSFKANKQQKLLFERLKADFKETVQRYNNLQKVAAQKAKSAVVLNSQQKQSKNLINWGEEDDKEELLKRQQQEEQYEQLQAQDALIDSDLSLLQEREERIRQLEGDILDINEIFRDLGALVHEQGEAIDTIEANVETAYSQVEQGNQQLEQAARYQRKSRKKLCILMLILVIIVAIIAVIIYVSMRK